MTRSFLGNPNDSLSAASCDENLPCLINVSTLQLYNHMKQIVISLSLVKNSDANYELMQMNGTAHILKETISNHVKEKYFSSLLAFGVTNCEDVYYVIYQNKIVGEITLDFMIGKITLRSRQHYHWTKTDCMNTKIHVSNKIQRLLTSLGISEKEYRRKSSIEYGLRQSRKVSGV